MKHMAEPLKGNEHPEQAASQRGKMAWKGGRTDPLRRFTPTPYGADLLVMGKTVRLETNNLTVVDCALEFFARHQGAAPGNPQFLWRILSQEDSQMRNAGVALSAFSDHGLRFANVGQRSFLAVDLDACLGIGFVAERLVEHEPRVECRSIFDTLFCMSAGSLGLVPLSAACVGLGEKGVLILGPPNSGKTSASYLATKFGLEFHADQAVFLEIDAGGLRVWGDFLPAIFRWDTLQFLPELRTSARRFSYPELSAWYLPKRPLQAQKAHSVVPSCCLFLERQVSSLPSLSSIARIDLSHRLAENMLFKEDDRFARQTAGGLDALEKLPGYHLAYGSDPAIAANVVRQLLTDCEHSGGPIAVESREAEDRRPEKARSQSVPEIGTDAPVTKI